MEALLILSSYQRRQQILVDNRRRQMTLLSCQTCQTRQHCQTRQPCQTCQPCQLSGLTPIRPSEWQPKRGQSATIRRESYSSLGQCSASAALINREKWASASMIVSIPLSVLMK